MISGYSTLSTLELAFALRDLSLYRLQQEQHSSISSCRCPYILAAVAQATGGTGQCAGLIIATPALSYLYTALFINLNSIVKFDWARNVSAIILDGAVGSAGASNDIVGNNQGRGRRLNAYQVHLHRSSATALYSPNEIIRHIDGCGCA